MSGNNALAKEKKGFKKIFFGSVLGYINTILSVVSGLVFAPLFIKYIGQGNYGLYSLSNSLITLFLFDFGLGITTNAYLSKLRAKNDDTGIKNFISLIFKIYFYIDLLLMTIFTVVFFFIPNIYVGLSAEEISTFKIIYILTAACNVIVFPSTAFNGVLNSYEEFAAVKIADIIHKLVYIALSATVLILKVGVVYLVLANCISSLVSMIIKLLVYKKKINIRISLFKRSESGSFKTVLLFSIWAAIYSLTTKLIFNIMPSILGITSNSNEITLFSLSASLEGYIYTFGAVFSGLFMPLISRIKEQEETYIEARNELAIRIGRYQLFFITLLLLGFGFSGYHFICFWTTVDKPFVVYLGTLLMAAYNIIFVPEIVFLTEMMTDRTKMRYLCIISIIKASINLLLAIPLSLLYGAIGSCISVCVARMIELVLLNIAFKKKLNSSVGAYFKRVYVSFAIPFAATVVVGVLLNVFLKLSHIYMFLICGFSVVIVFVALTLVFAIKPKEIRFVARQLKERI